MKKMKSRLNKGMAEGTEVFAKELKSLILTRTAKGTGVNGSFKKYTKKYAELKGDPTVNLSNTGKMLGAMKVKKINKNTYRVGFSNKKEETKAGHVGKIRPFMGLNKNEEKVLFKKFGNTFKRYV
ncbi:MAG: hypothetical protein CMK92_06095 [Pseudomonas sp.]|jgi:hypothetical protein|nr:hypothetical protein [Pseudomonas sp.]